MTRAGGVGQFRARVRRWARQIAVKPQVVEFGAMRAKWASCSSDGRIRFSDDVLQQPSAFQDLVIVHELLHLRIRNHGPLFRMLLGVYVPDWRSIGGGRIGRRCSRRGVERF